MSAEIGSETGRVAALGNPLAPETIRAAWALIDPAFVGSPQFVSDALSSRAAVPVVVKIECANPIGAFKGRGTWLAIRRLVEDGRVGEGRPIVAASTGNFGQGCAFAGRAFGVPVVIFADVAANPLKLDRIRRFGATVIQEGSDFDAARAASEVYAAERNALLLVDGQDPWIAAGAGTIALELTDGAAEGALPDLGTAFVPVGNGALIVGVGAWLRSAAPGCRVVGVQSERAPSMTRSWREGRPIETDTADTWAGGIATRVPVPEALDQMRGRVDDMVLVSDEALRDAQAELTSTLGITVEGGGAASWAASVANRDRLEGPVLVLITGSNAEPRLVCGGDGPALGLDCLPVCVDALGVTGSRVAGEEVQRQAVIGDLVLPVVGAVDRPELAGHAGAPRRRHAVRHRERRPRGRAAARAGTLAAVLHVLGEVVDRHPVRGRDQNSADRADRLGLDGLRTARRRRCAGRGRCRRGRARRRRGALGRGSTRCGRGRGRRAAAATRRDGDNDGGQADRR